MKQLQRAIRDLTATQQELNRFLIEVQVNLSNHLDECKCGGCDHACSKCNESHRICDKAQDMLGDK